MNYAFGTEQKLEAAVQTVACQPHCQHSLNGGAATNHPCRGWRKKKKIGWVGSGSSGGTSSPPDQSHAKQFSTGRDGVVGGSNYSFQSHLGAARWCSARWCHADLPDAFAGRWRVGCGAAIRVTGLASVQHFLLFLSFLFLFFSLPSQDIESCLLWSEHILLIVCVCMCVPKKAGFSQ